MKYLQSIIFSIALILVVVNNSYSQCAGATVAIDEESLAPANGVTADAANPSSSLETGVAQDIWDATTGAPGTDGTNDVQMSWQAFTYTSPGNTGGLGNFTISANPGGTPDFAASGSNNDAGGGYVVVTIDLLNGFSTTPAGFNLPWTSNNGSCECYEYSFGFVTAAQDASGTAITGLNTTAAVTSQIQMYTYNGQYNAGGGTGVGGAMTGAFTPIGDFSMASTVGIFTSNADDRTADEISNAGTGDVNSGSGPNNGGSSGPFTGLGATDEITQIVYIYGVNNASGPVVSGDTDVSTTPSGNINSATACPPPPPCAISNTAITPACSGTDATMSLTFDVADPAGTGAMVQYDVVAATACAANSINIGDVLGTFMAADMGTGLTGMITITGSTMACPIDVTLQQNGNTACSETITTNIPECMCSVTGEIMFEQECGILTISVINITESGTTGPNILLDLLDDGVSNQTGMVATGTGSFAFTTTVPNDGSSYSVILTDSGSAACTSTAGPVASPADNSPNVPAFVPNGTTTGN